MKKVVIIGGGFAGTKAARLLEKNYDVVLIDSKEYFEYTPGILRSIVEPKHVRKVQVLHSHYLGRAKIIVGLVREVSEKFVKVNGRKINFDYLVIAAGSRYNWPIKEQNLIIATRANHLRNCSSELLKARKIVIIGGGLVGVELAAEICTRFKDKEITIMHSGATLISRNHKKSIDYSESFLVKRGVRVVYNQKVKVKGKGFKTKEGKKIEADMIFLCTGITPNFEFMKKNFGGKLKNSGYVKVNDFLQVSGCENIFAVGDVAAVKEEKTAQSAEIQAEVVVQNINSLEKGKPLVSYVSKKRPMVISLGKYDGVFEWGGFVLRGIVPAILKEIIERKVMKTYK